MRYAVISDIHSNLEALTCVLDHIKKRGIKEIICLGDVIGYGPTPLECVELIMDNCVTCLKGNHDEALIEGVCFFNPIAREAIEWTREFIQNSEHPRKEEMWSFLENLPMIFTMEDYKFVHGSTLDPTSDYILAREIHIEERKFVEIFTTFEKVLFTGHTHMPCVITESLDVLTLDVLGYKYQVGNEKVIVNVGSVGQPRDKDTRACYLEVIDDFFFFHRVPYDHDKVCQLVLDNPHLDDRLGKRLQKGM